PRRPAPSPGPVARPRRPAPSPGPVARDCRPWLSPVAVARGCRPWLSPVAVELLPVARPRKIFGILFDFVFLHCMLTMLRETNNEAKGNDNDVYSEKSKGFQCNGLSGCAGLSLFSGRADSRGYAVCNGGERSCNGLRD